MAQFCSFGGNFGANIGFVPGHSLVLLPRPLLLWHISMHFWPFRTSLGRLRCPKGHKAAIQRAKNSLDRGRKPHFGPFFTLFLDPKRLTFNASWDTRAVKTARISLKTLKTHLQAPQVVQGDFWKKSSLTGLEPILDPFVVGMCAVKRG